MMVSLYRGETYGRFRYLSVSSRAEGQIVVKEIVLASSGRRVLSSDEFFFRYDTATKVDEAIFGLVRSRVSSGFQLVYANLPPELLPRSTILLRELEPKHPPTLADWLTSYLPPSSEC